MANTPYAFTSKCVQRLQAEYAAHLSLIVACDFDDTVFDFHNDGHEYQRVLDVLKDCQQLDFKIMLFTAGHPDSYPKQKSYLRERGIVVCPDVNKNPVPLPFGHHGKPYYNILLDDRAGLGQALDILEATIFWIRKDTRCLSR